MKIPASIRRIFDEAAPTYNRLKLEVDQRLLGLKHDRWHYESRIKGIESFTQKIETGRVPNPRQLEDFLACTYVVPNLAAIESAERTVLESFRVSQRRPPHRDKTRKAPECFPFDDLRLYVSIGEDVRYKPTGLEGMTFELQIKTFLQHAWAIATHDLIYKSGTIEWPKERIAFQIKAMLEHAEVSIDQAQSLAGSEILARTTDKFLRIAKLIELIRSIWGNETAVDVRRLATTIDELRDGLGLPQDKLEAHLRTYLKARGGQPPLNLSPYLAFVECLLECETESFVKFLYERPSRKRPRQVLITGEIDLPAAVDRSRLHRAILIGFG